MLKRPVDNLEKNAVYCAIVASFVKGTAFFAIVYFVWRGESLIKILIGYSVALFLAASTEYLWYYRPNMRRHRALLEKEGASYKIELESELTDTGLFFMLQNWWFVKRLPHI